MKNVKDILRINAKIIRNNLDTEQYSSTVAEIILKNELYKQARHIMLFYPIGSEISLLSLLKDETKTFYFPTVCGTQMYPVPYSKYSGFKTGRYNIHEPIGQRLNDTAILDIIFVPALAADIHGGRLGYGKGYYDRFLRSISQRCKTIVPISSELLFNRLPLNEHDICVDYIVTEKTFMKTDFDNKALDSVLRTK